LPELAESIIVVAKYIIERSFYENAKEEENGRGLRARPTSRQRTCWESVNSADLMAKA
jgi:hypothetical protein